jgi:SAM-dependent methyltransferase
MRWALARFHSQVRALLPADTTSLLEVGCGEGFSARAVLAGQNMRAYGGDLNAAAVQQARQRCPAMACAVFDALWLPFPDGCVDVVLSLEVLEHLPDPARALNEYRRVARRHLLLSVPNEPNFRLQRLLSGKGVRRLGDHPEHVQHWSLAGFRRFVESQGISVTAAVSPPPFAWSVLLCAV